MSRLLIALVFGLLFAASGATASTPTATMLLNWCQAGNKSNFQTYCSLYIAGYVQALEVAQVQPQGSSTEICFPAHFTASEAELIFVRFMRTHGSENDFMEQPPEQVLWVALSLEYPCNGAVK
jgi:hypothetical protein